MVASPAVPRQPPRHIRTIVDLREHLQAAIELEHATIPPYLTALYTIRTGANPEAAEIIRTVVVQEMLHIILAANVLNAIGGAPTIADPRFVPDYPAAIPVGREGPLHVDIQKFSPQAIATFLAIERPARPPAATIAGFAALAQPIPVEPGQLPDMLRRGELYASIGEFYDAIERGLCWLEAEAHREQRTIFTGDPIRQVQNGFYYNSGGAPVAVTNLEGALAALKVIVDQGEGYGDTIDDGEDVMFHRSSELAHYYRFNEIAHGRRYKPTDKPSGPPSGEAFVVDYGPDAVYQMVENPSTARYEDPELRARSRSFTRTYSALLRVLQTAFNGNPDALVPAVPIMFELEDSAVTLMRNPASAAGGRAGPHFQYLEETAK
jgi:hypothetical protein